jgi:hypothetical protein
MKQGGLTLSYYLHLSYVIVLELLKTETKIVEFEFKVQVYIQILDK